MKIKKYIWSLGVAALFAAAFTNCSDWTEPEARKMVDYDNTEIAKTEEYYQALRDYKKTDHSISFGWFSGWNEPSTSMIGTLASIPDSMDMISIWGQWGNLSVEKQKDLRYVQEVKGLKVVFASFTQNVGQNVTPSEHNVDEKTRNAFWGWKEWKELAPNGKDSILVVDEVAAEIAIRKYAGAFVDSVYKYGYDGFDMDHEPNFGGGGKLSSYPGRIHVFLSEIRRLFDEKGGGKLLVVDGEPQVLRPESGPIVDWMIVQAYTVGSGSPPPNATGTEADKDRRLNTCINNFTGVLTPEEVTNKYVVTENMESAIDALNGCFFWQLRDGTTLKKEECPSLLGMARWQPANGFRKGGFGGYRFDAEAVNKPAYKWMRRGIQAQNPAVN